MSAQNSELPQTAAHTSSVFKAFQVFFLIAVLSGPIFLGAVHLWIFSFSTFILAASFLWYWLQVAMRSDPLPIYRTDLDIWIVWYLLFFCLAAVQSKIPYQSLVEFFKLLSIFLAFIAAFHYCKDKPRNCRSPRIDKKPPNKVNA